MNFRTAFFVLGIFFAYSCHSFASIVSEDERDLEEDTPLHYPSSDGGRYRLHVASSKVFGSYNEVPWVIFLLDTETGMVWKKSWVDKEWKQFSTPIPLSSFPKVMRGEKMQKEE